jgi:hypothetical protein
MSRRAGTPLAQLFCVGGIIGKLSVERHETLAHPVLEQMLDVVRHRGTHGRGIYTAPSIALEWRGEELTADADIASNETRTSAVAAGAAPTNASGLHHLLTRVGLLLRRRSSDTPGVHCRVAGR